MPGCPSPMPARSVRQKRASTSAMSGAVTISGARPSPPRRIRTGDFGTAGCFEFVGGSCAVPTHKARALPGGVVAIDPAGENLTYGEVFDQSTTRAVNGFQVRTPFPTNMVPVTRMDSVALAIQNMFPMPNNSGIINNYAIPAYTNFFHTTNWSFKLDHSLRPTMKLSWFYSNKIPYSPNANGFTQPFTGATPNGFRPGPRGEHFG